MLPMAIVDELFLYSAGVADTTLAGEDSPLVVEQGPPELAEPSLRALKSVLPDRESGVSAGLPPMLVVSAVLSCRASFGRLSSSSKLT